MKVFKWLESAKKGLVDTGLAFSFLHAWKIFNN